jgi:hypothetical protein
MALTHTYVACAGMWVPGGKQICSVQSTSSDFDSVAVASMTGESLQLDPGRESKAAVLLRKRFSCIEAVALR